MMIYIELYANSGTKYTVRKPMGRMGAIHFGIITKYMPTNKNRDPEAGMSPLEQERIGQAFDEWSVKVLPHILVNYTPPDAKEPITNITIDDIDGPDQYSIFLALTSTMTVNSDFFRVIS
jgi:hypothetical protein